MLRTGGTCTKSTTVSPLTKNFQRQQNEYYTKNSCTIIIKERETRYIYKTIRIKDA